MKLDPIAAEVLQANLAQALAISELQVKGVTMIDCRIGALRLSGFLLCLMI